VSPESLKSKASKGFFYSLGGFCVWKGEAMAEERVKRKLTAILSADVKGYSRLMGEDEISTMQTLKKYREVMAGLVEEYEGRVIDSPGDNILAEFGSVVDGVECAVKIQRELKKKNAELSEDRRMEFRIGVNLGDVIDDEGRIYGDGVNVASRVEGLAEGGGICISGTAFDQIGKKLPLGYEFLGEQEVKNIEKPVRVYKILTEPEAVGKLIEEEKPKPKGWRWAVVVTAIVILTVGVLAIWNFYVRPPRIEPASLEKMAFPLPDKPSIAVLPFVNMSGDPEQESFCDGLTDNVITSLSRIPHLFVIASNSTFTYKGKPVKVQQVAEDLGVQYVLEGSIQKSGKRVRFRVQLIDALTGRHLWAESYDRNLEDIFALQDEIASKVITSLQVKLTSGEYARAAGKATKNLQALQSFWRAQHHLLRFTKEDNALAKQYAEKAIEIDPEFSTGWAELGFTHLYDSSRGWSSSRKQSMKLAEECAQKALSLNPTEPKALLLLCRISHFKRKYDKAIEYAERAVEANPNNPFAFHFLGISMGFAGRSEEAIANARRAMRLAPHHPPPFLIPLAYHSFFLRRYDDALSAGEKLLERSRKGQLVGWIGYLLMVAIYSELGQDAKARKYAADILNANPNWNLKVIEGMWPFKDQSHLNRLLYAGRKAGLPETPPLLLPDKPSIAVLPFANMSADPEQEYFSDGITEEIITALSKTPKLFVIARTSSFRYKGKEVDVRTVGRELGVRYVLEGSVRKSEDQLRITAKLVDAKTGSHLWAEGYDRELKDVFAVQDEITKKIITELQVKLTVGEQARFRAKGTENLQAYLKYLRAREYFFHFTPDDNTRARKLLTEVIAMDPTRSKGHRNGSEQPRPTQAPRTNLYDHEAA
jgi:TolB-like protein/class 3 adenylate cyclase